MVLKSCTREVLYTEVLHAPVLVFQIMDFSRLKCQLKRKKKLAQHVSKDFPSFG